MLSQHLGQLDSLRLLDLSGAHIPGSLPPQLFEGLPNLVVLSLASNQLTGTLPAELSSLSSLRFLDLSNNSLHGTIPQSAWAPLLANLESLDLSDNHLRGLLPASVAAVE